MFTQATEELGRFPDLRRDDSHVKNKTRNQTPCLWMLKLTAFIRASQRTIGLGGLIGFARVIGAKVSSPPCNSSRLSLLLATLWGGFSAFVQNKASSTAYQNDRLGMQITSLLTFKAYDEFTLGSC